MVAPWRQLWLEGNGQDIAEYAVMLAVILVLVVVWSHGSPNSSRQPGASSKSCK